MWEPIRRATGAGSAFRTTLIQGKRKGVRKILLDGALGQATGIALELDGNLCGDGCGDFALVMAALDPVTQSGRLLFLCVSAVSNVGYSHEQLSLRITTQCVLSAAMLLGRVMPLVMLWWMERTTDGTELAVG